MFSEVRRYGEVPQNELACRGGARVTSGVAGGYEAFFRNLARNKELRSVVPRHLSETGPGAIASAYQRLSIIWTPWKEFLQMHRSRCSTSRRLPING